VELEPQDGKDEEYDELMNEIKDLEGTLERELKTLQKKLGCAIIVPAVVT
jgi:DNA mismatch repair protein MSH6